MADTRNALDKHLGVTEQDHIMRQYARYRALVAHTGQALAAQNYAAAQVYALLMIAEQMPGETVAVHWAGWEDHADRIAGAITQALGR